MGNTDKKKSKKFSRKIRIKLLDPTIPDSYVCEIFDSSSDSEDEFLKNDSLSQTRKKNYSKPKNYFELLMSKNGKKNIGCYRVKKSEGCSVSTDEDESFLSKSQKRTKKNNNSFTQCVGLKNKELNKSESSGNENFFKIQEKNNGKHAEHENVKDTDINTKNQAKNDVITIFDSPKLEVAEKKTLSILNYFSKSKPSSEKSSAVEIKTCQLERSLKSNKENNVSKLCHSSAKKLLGNTIQNGNLKLTSLCKSNVVLDSNRQQARLAFLNSGLPPAIKKLETTECRFYYPKVIHVQQRNESIYWSPREICLPLQKNCCSEFTFNGNKKFALEIKHSRILDKAASDCTVNINTEQLNEIKFQNLKLNLNSLIDGLKDKKEKFSARLEQAENSKDNTGHEELNLLWTEKYKPRSEEMLGNTKAVKKLRKWLQLWKSFNDELNALVAHNRSSEYKEDSSDVDDFLDFNSENFGLKAPGNVCIISGPNGCGKTALVYALANELEFSVLELNASSKRTGKKVLAEVQEATQSHKVHQVNLLQNNLVQMNKKNKKNSNSNSKKSGSKTKSDQVGDTKISVILIEDADITFNDHDEGFHSAMVSLVQTSKRPLIFITNEPNSFCLENLKQDQCLTLEMEPPDFYKSCAVLDIVSSLEGVNFDKEILESLVRHNNFDIRKSLLELQFWTISRSKIEYLPRAFDLGHLWWGLSKLLFKQNIKHFSKSKGRKRKRTIDLFDSSDDEAETAPKKFKSNPEDSINFCSLKTNAIIKASDPEIESYYSVLDLVSVLDGFQVTQSQEPIPGYECRPKDSLILSENMEEVLQNKSLAEQFSDEMINLASQIFLRKLKENDSSDGKLNFESPSWEEIRWRNSQTKASEELSKLVPLQRGTDKKSLYLDYLPTLRNICRVERHRSEVNPRRKNRFYHYLNNMGPELREEILEINCEIFYR